MIVKDIKIRGGLPFIVIQTMDGKDLRMLVDTGAENSVIEKEKLLTNVENGGQSIGQSGVAIDILKGTLNFTLDDDLEIGSKHHELTIDVKCFRLSAISNGLGFKIDGILGSDFLRKNNAIINFNEEMLILNT